MTTKQLVFVENNRPVTDSLTVAESFGKEHRRVMQDIRDLECSEEFRLHHFVPSSYKNKQQRNMPCVIMTEQGFAFLVMGYTGREAAQFKEMYINEFERMRSTLNKPALPTNPVDLVLYQADMFKAIAVAMAENQQKVAELETKVETVALETSNQLNDLRKGLVDIDAPLRTDLQALITDYSTLTGKNHRDAWHFLYDNLNSRNRCNIQRRYENRLKKDPNYKGKKLDIIEEMRLLPDAIRFMKAVVENLKLLAKQVVPAQNPNDPF